MANAPQWTSPLYATDEQVAIRCTGDYYNLCPPWQTLAAGSDGVFSSGTPWVLTSASVNFEAQGVGAQNVLVLTAPKPNFPGGATLMAVDSVTGNAVTLRRIGQPSNVGQPPGAAAGTSAVSFSVPTLGPQLDNATWQIKSRFGIDEQIVFRNSAWIYAGAEDAYRDLRDAVVFTVCYDRYTFENRTDKGDFAGKAKVMRQILDDVLARVQVRFGPFGDSSPAATLFNCKLSR